MRWLVNNTKLPLILHLLVLCEPYPDILFVEAKTNKAELEISFTESTKRERCVHGILVLFDFYVFIVETCNNVLDWTSYKYSKPIVYDIYSHSVNGVSVKGLKDNDAPSTAVVSPNDIQDYVSVDEKKTQKLHVRQTVM